MPERITPAEAGAPDLATLRAEARYSRERYELYQAKVYSMRPTSMTRLRELERAHHAADARLRSAEEQPVTRGANAPRSAS
jgi:hypothetical protein